MNKIKPTDKDNSSISSEEPETFQDKNKDQDKSSPANADEHGLVNGMCDHDLSL